MPLKQTKLSTLLNNNGFSHRPAPVTKPVHPVMMTFLLHITTFTTETLN